MVILATIGMGGVLRTGAFPPGCLCAAAQQICETILGAATRQTEGAVGPVGGTEEEWGDQPQKTIGKTIGKP